MRQRLCFTICCLLASLSWRGVHATEPLQSVVARLTAPPVITAQSGFSAQLLVPPGQLYDPLVTLPVGQVMWLNDDGGQEDGKGSRVLAVDARGGSQKDCGLRARCPLWAAGQPFRESLDRHYHL